MVGNKGFSRKQDVLEYTKLLIVNGADKQEVAENLQLNDEDMENVLELIEDDDSESKQAYLEY